MKTIKFLKSFAKQSMKIMSVMYVVRNFLYLGRKKIGILFVFFMKNCKNKNKIEVRFVVIPSVSSIQKEKEQIQKITRFL